MKYLFFLKAGNYITCHIEIARALASHTAAILLSELCEKYCHHLKNGELISDERHGDEFFYYTADLCEERTALSRKEQDTAINILIKLGLITKVLMGLPSKRYFKLNHYAIESFISDIQKKFSILPQTGKLDSGKQVCPKRANCIAPNGQTSHIYDEYNDEYKQQQQKVAEPQKSYGCDSVVVSSGHEKKNQPYEKIVHLKIYDCLLKIDIPQDEKTWLVNHYPEECVKNAIEWVEATKDKIKTTYIAYLKMACEKGLSVRDLPKAKMDTFDELKLHFENYGIYNGATCYLNPKEIAFERGSRNEPMEINKFFCWKKFKNLCEIFGIEFDRNKK